jgi:threonine aldolase
MIDLSSDTATKPSAGMREAIRTADVGDEQKGEDPTVNRLLDMVSDLMGKEAALFLPSGTMCNLVAIKTHTQPGETILVEELAHILRMESGGAALASGVIVDTIDSEHGQFTPGDVLRALPAPLIYKPLATVLCVEQTHNFRGGTTWTVAELEAVAEVAHENGLAVHMDGARLMNAVVACGESAQRFAAPCDSVWLDFTKGLGAPMGAVLAGSRDFVERARRYKHVFGGAMRQAGIIAAGCIYALEHNIERLQEDHTHAKLLAEGLNSTAGVRVTNRVDTNIVYFDAIGAGMESAVFQAAMMEQAVCFSRVDDLLRAVTHLDVSPDDIDQALATTRKVLNGAS